MDATPSTTVIQLPYIFTWLNTLPTKTWKEVISKFIVYVHSLINIMLWFMQITVVNNEGSSNAISSSEVQT